MTPEQLDLVVARTKHERYRWLTSGENPNVEQREAYRATVARMADRPWPPPEPQPTAIVAAPPPSYPPLVEQLRGLASSLAAWARSGFRLATSAEARRRRGICKACPLFDRPSGRCRACGCMAALKPWLASATCPRGRWGPQGPSS